MGNKKRKASNKKTNLYKKQLERKERKKTEAVSEEKPTEKTSYDKNSSHGYTPLDRAYDCANASEPNVADKKEKMSHTKNKHKPNATKHNSNEQEEDLLKVLSARKTVEEIIAKAKALAFAQTVPQETVPNLKPNLSKSQKRKRRKKSLERNYNETSTKINDNLQETVSRQERPAQEKTIKEHKIISEVQEKTENDTLTCASQSFSENTDCRSFSCGEASPSLLLDCNVHGAGKLFF